VARLTLETFGAWLLKCNPKVTDLPSLMEHGVATWCVQKNYRTALCDAGQPALLWVSGSTGATPTPGIWAGGRLTGPATWRGAKYVVPLRLTFLEAPVSRTELAAHPALGSLEVLNQPQMSNPSYLTATEYANLRELL
jgi:hypothetical protein